MADKTAAEAPKPEPALANKETTELQVPETMHIEATPETPPEESREKAENPRDAIMKRIIEKHAAQREKELGLGAELAKEERERTEAAESKPEPAPEPTPEPVAAAPEPPAPQPQPAPEPAKRTFKVNGRDIAVTDDELVRLAQLGIGANEKFQEAARLRQEAEALRTNTAPQGTAPAQQSAPQAAPTQDILDDATAREFFKRIQYGSEEDGAKALRDLSVTIAKQMQGRPQATPEQIAATAAQHAVETVRFQTNLETVGNEFKEVFADDNLTLAAANEVGKLRQKYHVLQQPKSELEIYREACGLVKDRYLKPAQNLQPQPQPNPPVQAAPAVSASAEKLERKRAAPKPLAAASAKASLGAETPRAPTGAELVNKMRQARGQPVLT